MTDGKTDKTDAIAVTPTMLEQMGADEVGYMRIMRSEEIAEKFPGAPDIEPGHELYAVFRGDGTPILLTDTREAAADNLAKLDLTEVSVH